MANRIDASRHQKIFDPEKFGARPVHVVGCGATGSRIAVSLAKLGINNIQLWDFDHVEEHNLANQVFGLDDIGHAKVEALQLLLHVDCGVEAGAHEAAVKGDTKLEGVVFLLTDTMKSRKEIWEGAIRYKAVEFMVETRMGVDDGRVYAVRPQMRDDVKQWEATLYDDEAADPSTCGSKLTIGPTADILSGLAMWSFLQWWGHHEGRCEPPDFETIFGVNPLSSLTRSI